MDEDKEQDVFNSYFCIAESLFPFSLIINMIYFSTVMFSLFIKMIYFSTLMFSHLLGVYKRTLLFRKVQFYLPRVQLLHFNCQ